VQGLLFAACPAFAQTPDLQALKRMIDDAAQLTDQAPAASLAAKVRLSELGQLPVSRRVLLDVRSNHSDGAHDMEMLAGLARQRGIDTLVFGEHDRYTIRLGLDPVAPLIGISQEHPSLYSTGLQEFFADLEQLRKRHPELQIMAATESAPGYDWSGLPFIDLTLHEAERHIIALGIERPAQVEALPSYDLRNISGSRSLSLVVWGGVAFILLIVLLRRRRKGVLLPLSFVVLLAILLFVWLRGGDAGADRDADGDFIEAAREQGLLTIWAHPGTRSGVRDGPLGVKLDTPPYNRHVFREPTADAFAAVYGDTDDNTVPGGMWDRFMMDYMRGYRPKPIWAVAAGDYHAEGFANEYLGNFPMDVWSEETGPQALIEALRRGRNTSWFMVKKLNLKMAALFLETESGQRLLPGDEAEVSGRVRLHAGLAQWFPEGAGEQPKVPELTGQWIVDGRVAAQAVLAADGTVSVTPMNLKPGAHVVRLRIPYQHGARMEANPFLLWVPR